MPIVVITICLYQRVPKAYRLYACQIPTCRESHRCDLIRIKSVFLSVKSQETDRTL